MSDDDNTVYHAAEEISPPGSPSSHSPVAPEPEGTTRSSLHYSLLGPSLLKAGQDGVDQNKISEIIYNASKGSKFFAHEEKRDEALTLRIETILRRKRELEAGSVVNELRRVDEQIAGLERDRDLSQIIGMLLSRLGWPRTKRIIVHVDCDAFFASVEELYRPELKKVPMAVGGGVLSTCNYMARQFGVRSGMAGHIAKKVCPQLVFVKPNFERYNSKATEIREVLAKYDQRFEAASVDEAYLNITPYLQEHPKLTPDSLVEQIRKEVLETTKVSVSAGIAPNAKIAKIASNQNKPNGQFRVQSTREAVMTFMSTLPVRKINGVGRVFERELEAVGIKTCGDIFTHRGLLRQLFGDKAFDFLLNMYLGLGRTKIRPAEEYERKSVGTERTFRDLSGAENLREKLRVTAEELEKDLKKAGCAGKVLVLKVKLHTYEVLTRQRNLLRPVVAKEELYSLALPLLQALEAEFPVLKVRLMGLRVTGLVSTKKEAVDMNKWFFGNSKPAPKRKFDEDGWEVWPEEEFEHAQRVEKEEELKLTQELEEELVAREKKMETEGEKEEREEHWQCPICGTFQPADDTTFNRHVDFCLSKEAIRNAVKESSKPPPPPPLPPAKKKRLGR
ncbi:hypothetical protein FN846DRAFT_916487 [Sphaerosporella brunnea]|uniref:DNA polymerase kappa n=1 Tax=Sphaerosporella brunnea TaxID=1250544 RepID=A0A5J5F8C6_9PEZI|nr:hypothetical protein FN846DRAFT_916487 [Sphaerosporella brunnea]